MPAKAVREVINETDKPEATWAAGQFDHIDEDRPLTHKQRLFVDYFIVTLNASKAAELAGYNSCSPQSRYVTAHSNLHKPHIRKAIREALRGSEIAREEVLARLAMQARASLEDFMEIDENGTFSIDLKKAQELGVLGLVKKVAPTKNGGYSIELHDSQSALALLGRYFGLFTDRREISGPGGGPIQLDHEIDVVNIVTYDTDDSDGYDTIDVPIQEAEHETPSDSPPLPAPDSE